jgi:predicted acetyltransferase
LTAFEARGSCNDGRPLAPVPCVALVKPNAFLRDSYRRLVDEFVERGEKPVPFVLTFDHHDIEAMLVRLEQCARGIGVGDGFVPHSTFWLVENGLEVVGVANIRHSLTPALRVEGGNIGYGIRPSARGRGLGTILLSLALESARKLGLTEVLLTCGKDNMASARIIRRNGGVLESEEYLEHRGEVVQRYVVSLGST